MEVALFTIFLRGKVRDLAIDAMYKLHGWRKGEEVRPPPTRMGAYKKKMQAGIRKMGSRKAKAEVVTRLLESRAKSAEALIETVNRAKLSDSGPKLLDKVPKPMLERAPFKEHCRRWRDEAKKQLAQLQELSLIHI